MSSIVKGLRVNEVNLSINSLLKINEELRKEIAKLHKVILERDAIIAKQGNKIKELGNYSAPSISNLTLK